MTHVFIDIDGTCANAKDRFDLAGEEPKSRGARYSLWLRRVQSKAALLKDKPVSGMSALVRSLGFTCNTTYLTARSEVYRNVTRLWLYENGFPTFDLIMRPKGSRMSSVEFKEAVIKRMVMPLDSVVVIDDDPTGEFKLVCNSNSWTLLKAVSGS